MANSTPIRYNNFDGLLNNGVSDFLRQNNELAACKNVWIYKIGKLEKVPGYTLSADEDTLVLDQSLSFLHYYYDVAGDKNYQIGGSYDGSDYILQVREEANWSATKFTYSGASADTVLSAQNFLGKAFIVGHDGTTFLDPMTANGSVYTKSAVTDTDLLDMPKGKFITGTFFNRIFVMNCEVGGTKYPSRAYFSDEVIGEKITWPATKYLTCGHDDGDVLVGGGVCVDRLVMLKQRSMWKAADLATPKKIADVGCSSARSIKVIDNVIYWFNEYGFWRWRGSTPELISERAKEYIDAIDPDNYDKIFACEYYKKEYRAFVGDIVVGNDLYHNAWFCFDTLRQRIYIRCTYHTVASAGNYIEGNKTRAYFGTESGYLHKFAEKADRVFSDAGKEIDSFFDTNLLDHGVPEDVKFTNHMTVFTINNHSMKVAVAADNEVEWGQDNEDIINKNVQQVEIAASANRFRYRFYEKSDGLSWEFEGFVIETQIKEEAYSQ